MRLALGVISWAATAAVWSAHAFSTLRMGPALPPGPVGTLLPGSRDTANPKALVELYFDLACPYAGKCFTTLQTVSKEFAGKDVVWRMMHVPQPWHPQSLYQHEAAFAVKRVSPQHFFPFCAEVWRVRESSYRDCHTVDKTRSQIYDELASLATAVGADGTAVRELLKIRPGGSGTSVTQDVKYAVQHHRKRGVHVTPTVFINGIQAVDVTSAYTVEQWRDLINGLLDG